VSVYWYDGGELTQSGGVTITRRGEYITLVMLLCLFTGMMVGRLHIQEVLPLRGDFGTEH
jgi:hypothetical protein